MGGGGVCRKKGLVSVRAILPRRSESFKTFLTPGPAYREGQEGEKSCSSSFVFMLVNRKQKVKVAPTHKRELIRSN